MTLSGISGGGRKPPASQSTHLNLRSVSDFRRQVLNYLKKNDLTKLSELFRLYFEQHKIGNLAKNLGQILEENAGFDDFKPQLFDLLKEAAGGEFYILFAGLSSQSRGQLAVVMRERDMVLTALVLNQLITAMVLSGNTIKQENSLEAASALIFADVMHYLLNNFVVDKKKESVLSLVYQKKYGNEPEIKISQLLSEYQACGLKAEGLSAFKRILDGFLELAIASELV
jgi:hypothetical protein